MRQAFELPLADMDKWAEGFQLADMYEHSDSDEEDDGNNDGMNDVWEIKNLNYYPNNSVKIYNRWGTPIFQAAPYLNNWQGQSDASLSIGNELTSGTYYYILELGDNSEPRKGAITLKID